MAVSIRRRTAAVTLGGGALLVGAALVAHFAAPDRESPPAPPPAPPLLAPDRVRAPASPAVGHANPAVPGLRDKAGECGGAAGPLVVPPHPVTPPRTWFSTDDYPALALRQASAGRVSVEVVVGARGQVIGCGVASSSGHAPLDTKSCLVLRARARFDPARDARGCPVAAVYPLHIRWVIPAIWTSRTAAPRAARPRPARHPAVRTEPVEVPPRHAPDATDRNHADPRRPEKTTPDKPPVQNTPNGL